MNAQELSEYNKLTPSQREEYDFCKKKHPNWDHKKLCTKVGFSQKTDEIIERDGDIDENDKEVMTEIVQGVGDWLEDMLPRIWDAVSDIFSNILSGILNGIVNFFSEIFSFF